MSRRQMGVQAVRRWTLAGAAALVVGQLALAAAAPARADDFESLVVSERILKFGVVKIDDRAARREVLVRNDGDDSVQLTVVGATAPFWALTESFTLQPEQSRRIVVSYAPRSPSISEGLLTIRSSDPDQALLEVKLLGCGTSNFAPAVPDIHGLWTTPRGVGFELVTDPSGRWVFGKFVLTLFPGLSGAESAAGEFLFEAYFDGQRLIGVWDRSSEEQAPPGDVAFNLTSDGTLVGCFSRPDDDEFQEMTLTPCMTDFRGRWQVPDGRSWLVLQDGSGFLTGSFELLDEDGTSLHGELVGIPATDGHTRCVLGSVEASLSVLEEPLIGTFDIYQIATGRIVCRLLFSGGWSLDIPLEGPF